MKKVLIIVLMLGVLVFPHPVAADANTTTISFSDLDLVSHSDIEIYGLNTTTWELLAVYNTSSTGIAFAPGVCQIVVRPSEVKRFSQPDTLFADALSFFETYWLPIVAILGLIALFVGRRR
jgi:hypothetical protein